MLLNSIVWPDSEEFERQGIPVTHEDVPFYKFLRKEIVPGGELCQPHEIIWQAGLAGLEVSEIESLQPHLSGPQSSRTHGMVPST